MQQVSVSLHKALGFSILTTAKFYWWSRPSPYTLTPFPPLLLYCLTLANSHLSTNLSFRTGTAEISALKVCTSAGKCKMIHFNWQLYSTENSWCWHGSVFGEVSCKPASREPATCQLHWNKQLAFSSHDPAEVRTPAPIITAMKQTLTYPPMGSCYLEDDKVKPRDTYPCVFHLASLCTCHKL